MDEFEKIIEKEIGTALTFNYVNKQKYIAFETNDLTNKIGIAKRCFSKFFIERRLDKNTAWGSIDFLWEQENGGTNGSGFLRLAFKDGKWIRR